MKAFKGLHKTSWDTTKKIKIKTKKINLIFYLRPGLGRKELIFKLKLPYICLVRCTTSADVLIRNIPSIFLKVHAKKRTSHYQTGIYLLRANKQNTNTMCEICVKSWRRSCVFIVNFEQISHIFLVFPLLALNK